MLFLDLLFVLGCEPVVLSSFWCGLVFFDCALHGSLDVVEYFRGCCFWGCISCCGYDRCFNVGEDFSFVFVVCCYGKRFARELYSCYWFVKDSVGGKVVGDGRRDCTSSYLSIGACRQRVINERCCVFISWVVSGWCGYCGV